MYEVEQAGIELPIQVGFARAVVDKEGRQIGLFLNGHMQCREVEGDDLERVQSRGGYLASSCELSIDFQAVAIQLDGAGNSLGYPFALISSMLTRHTGHTLIRPCVMSISPRLASER